jgi:hypothetical protein
MTYNGDLLVRPGANGQGKLGAFANTGGFLSLTSPNHGAFIHMENSGNLVVGWTDGNGNPSNSISWWSVADNSFYNAGSLISSRWNNAGAANFSIYNSGDQRFISLSGARMVWTNSGAVSDTLYVDNTGGAGSIMIRGYGYNWLQLQTDGNLSMSNSWAAKLGGGTWADSSDIRGKTILGEYGASLNEIVQLKPIRYKFKNNLEILPHFDRPKELPADWVEPKPFRPHEFAGEKIFIGLAAQDCEGFMPEMIVRQNGFIDGKADDNIRGLDISPMLYAFINAFKVVHQRLTALESKQ